MISRNGGSSSSGGGGNADDEKDASVTGGGFCRAVSQRGALVTAYVGGSTVLAIPKRDGDFVCTQDPGHEKSHAACDGNGHILARWPQAATERYWRQQPAGA